MYRNIFNRLPDNYSREGQVNNEKFHQIIYGELEEIKQVFKDIKDYQDLDKAIGKTLDNIGKNVLELRATDNDEMYKQLIKTKIIANLSQGDVETINEVAKVLVGDSYAGVSETWNDEKFDNEIAALVMKLDEYTPNTPFDAFERVKAGGIRLYWELLNKVTTLKLETNYTKYDINYPMCGTYLCGTHPTTATDGLVLGGGGITLETKYVDDVNYYPMTNETTFTKE